jgi:hypothetical protein
MLGFATRVHVLYAEARIVTPSKNETQHRRTMKYSFGHYMFLTTTVHIYPLVIALKNVCTRRKI